MWWIYLAPESILALGDVGPPAELVIPVLLKGLDRDTTIQFPASTILRSYGQDAASAVPGLKELLKSQNETTRILAAGCLKGLRCRGRRQGKVLDRRAQVSTAEAGMRFGVPSAVLSF
jgi:hypothetical protein